MAQWSHLLLWATLLECIRLALGNWDYIVVGGGASGCTAASLFAATGKMVVVLEAGEETAWDFGGRAQSASFGMLDSSTVFDVPGENEKLRKTSKNWWQNLPWGLNGRGIGGSGMMNGALGFIPSPEDFDSWPSGWNYRDLIRSYRQILTGLSVTSTPSSDGLLYAQGAADAYELLAEKQLGLKKVGLNANPAGRTNTYSVTEVTAKDGQRMDPCKAFLLPALKTKSNLRLFSSSEVLKIAFKVKGQARGVILQNGREVLLNEGGKIVLAAGALQTPRLLMTSGIGPRSELNRLSSNDLVLNNEALWIDNNEVGRSMSDHSFSQMAFRVPNVPDFSFRYSRDQNDQQAANMYLKNASGPYAQYGPVRVGFMSRPGQSTPDVELLGMSSGVEGSQDRDCNTCFRILIMNLHPKARADFRIKTSNMDCDCGGNQCSNGDICKPQIYVTAEEDKEIIRWAVKRIAAAAEAEGYEVLTPSRADAAGIAEYVDNSGEARFSASHWTGTCKLGQCTDGDLKVKGTDNIFVVDLSLVPTPVRAHTFITAAALAHRACELIDSASVI